MPKVMAALLNIGGALCLTPQSFWLTPNTGVPCSNAAKTRNPLKFAGVPQTGQPSSRKKTRRRKKEEEETTGQKYNGLPYYTKRP